jgi:beta-1,2-mannobiose phosphorylase / 1,2-beta-oligomannan phosphorylase
VFGYRIVALRKDFRREIGDSYQTGIEKMLPKPLPRPVFWKKAIYGWRFRSRIPLWTAPITLACLYFLTLAGRCADSTNNLEEFPAELVHFEPYAKNPVFTAEGAGHWDVKIRERGWIMHEGNSWQMWFTGYDGNYDSQKMLGRATSRDGLNWTRDSGNPLDAKDWFEDMTVVRRGTKFYMFSEGPQDHAHWFTSPDGRDWTRQGTLDIRRVDGQPISPGPFGTPTVWFENDDWYLLYERYDQGVWLAKSNDLKVWANVQDEPVLEPGPSDYDKYRIAANQVVKYQGRYYVFYHGSGTAMPPRQWTTNVAVSTDRVHWKKYPGNPIVPGDRSSGIVVAVNGEQAAGESPENSARVSQFEFDRPTKFRLYTMHGQVEAFLPAAAK